MEVLSIKKLGSLLLIALLVLFSITSCNRESEEITTEYIPTVSTVPPDQTSGPETEEVTASGIDTSLIVIITTKPETTATPETDAGAEPEVTTAAEVTTIPEATTEIIPEATTPPVTESTTEYKEETTIPLPDTAEEPEVTTLPEPETTVEPVDTTPVPEETTVPVVETIAEYEEETTIPLPDTTEEPEVTTEPEPEEEYNPAPDFTVYNKEGNPVRLSDMLGKPVVLNFWASWCGPCKMEMPDFEEVYREIGDDVVFMIVNLTDGTYETMYSAQSFINSMGYTFPVYFDLDSDAAYTYGIVSIPTTFFISARGNLIAYAEGALDGETLKYGISLIYSEK